MVPVICGFIPYIHHGFWGCWSIWTGDGMMFGPYPITTVGERQGKQVGHLLYILLFSLRAGQSAIAKQHWYFLVAKKNRNISNTSGYWSVLDGFLWRTKKCNLVILLRFAAAFWHHRALFLLQMGLVEFKCLSTWHSSKQETRCQDVYVLAFPMTYQNPQ